LEEAGLTMDEMAAGLGVLALGFAVYSFFQQFRLQRRVTSIEEARRNEEVAARLVAWPLLSRAKPGETAVGATTGSS
jgi:hypothetical protein